MTKKTSLLLGVTLIILALLALAGNLILGTPRNALRSGFHSWSLAVVGIGLLFCLPPFLYWKRRGLAGLFIPGFPILTTGILLYVSSLTENWGLWKQFWPMELIGLALAFMLAAYFLRIVWLMIPASIIAFTGLVLQYCALTSHWEHWAVLWTVIPFSLGLPLTIIGIARHLRGLKLAGLILTGFAGLAFTAMYALLATDSGVMQIAGPIVIFLIGVFMVITALLKEKQT